MSLIDPTEFEGEETQKFEPMPDGWEGKINILNVTRKQNEETKKPYWILFCDVDGEPYAKEFTHIFNMPSRKDAPTEKSFKRALYDFWSTVDALGFDRGTPFDPIDFKGCSAIVILGQQNSKDTRFGITNYIREWIGGAE